MKPNQIQIGDVLVVVQAANTNLNDLNEKAGWANIGLSNSKGIRYERVYFLNEEMLSIDWRPAKYIDNDIFPLGDFEIFINQNIRLIWALIETLCKDDIKESS